MADEAEHRPAGRDVEAFSVRPRTRSWLFLAALLRPACGVPLSALIRTLPAQSPQLMGSSHWLGVVVGFKTGFGQKGTRPTRDSRWPVPGPGPVPDPEHVIPAEVHAKAWSQGEPSCEGARTE